ncbi:MAG: hypothetical protein GF401_14575 [Chitinivibrionales bacterium]|nr:hypothetical protein [Chitinivibrionales bacterium]
MAPGFQGGNSILKPLKLYKSLHQQKYRLIEGVFPVEGPRAVQQILTTAPHTVTEIISTTETLAGPEPECPRRVITKQQFKTISAAKNPQSPLALVTIPAGSFSDSLPDDTGPRLLLLEDIQDPGNIGTLIRTAAALGFSGIIMSDKCADPFSPRAVQASAGTILSLWIRRNSAYRAMIKKLLDNNYTFYASTMGGKSCKRIPVQPRCILALGNEGAGLSREVLSLAQETVAVPIDTAKAESLNVAAAGAILMYLLGND